MDIMIFKLPCIDKVTRKGKYASPSSENLWFVSAFFGFLGFLHTDASRFH